MNAPYKNKTYIVTGASSGIGKAITDMLLNHGASVVGIARKFSDIEHHADSIIQARVRSITCDLSDFKQLDKIFSATLKDNAILDGVVLCHGYGEFGSLETFSQAQIERMVDTNLTSHMLISRLVLPFMKRQKQGDLVIIGSESGLKAGKNGSVYCATKYALQGFVQSLRQECAASNVRISVVNPGMVDTAFFDHLEFTPGASRDNRLQATDVANAVKLILDMPSGSVVDEIKLSPQKHVIKNRKN